MQAVMASMEGVEHNASRHIQSIIKNYMEGQW